MSFELPPQVQIRAASDEDYSELADAGGADGLDYQEYRDLIRGLGSKDEIAEKLGFIGEEDRERFDNLFLDIDKADLIVGNDRVGKDDLFAALDMNGDGVIMADERTTSNVSPEGIWTTDQFANSMDKVLEKVLTPLLQPGQTLENTEFTFDQLNEALEGEKYDHLFDLLGGSTGKITLEKRDMAIDISNRAKGNNSNLNKLLNLIDASGVKRDAEGNELLDSEGNPLTDSEGSRLHAADGQITQEDVTAYARGDLLKKLAKEFYGVEDGPIVDKDGEKIPVEDRVTYDQLLTDAQKDELEVLAHAVYSMKSSLPDARDVNAKSVTLEALVLPEPVDIGGVKELLTLTSDEQKIISDSGSGPLNEAFLGYFERENENGLGLLEKLESVTGKADILKLGGIKADDIKKLRDIDALANDSETDHFDKILDIIEVEETEATQGGQIRYETDTESDYYGQAVLLGDGQLTLEEINNYIEGNADFARVEGEDRATYGSFDGLRSLNNSLDKNNKTVGDTLQDGVLMLRDRLQAKLDADYEKAVEGGSELTKEEFAEANPVSMSRGDAKSFLKISSVEEKFLSEAEDFLASNNPPKIDADDWAELSKDLKAMDKAFWNDFSGSNLTQDERFVLNQLLKNLDEFDADKNEKIKIADLKLSGTDSYNPLLTQQRDSLALSAYFTKPGLSLDDPTVFEQLAGEDKILTKAEISGLASDFSDSRSAVQQAVRGELELLMTKENLEFLDEIIANYDAIAFSPDGNQPPGVTLEEFDLAMGAFGTLGSGDKQELIFMRYANKAGELDQAAISEILRTGKGLIELTDKEDTSNIDDRKILEILRDDWNTFAPKDENGNTLPMTRSDFSDTVYAIQKIRENSVASRTPMIYQADKKVAAGQLGFEGTQNNKLTYIASQMKEDKGQTWGKTLHDDFKAEIEQRPKDLERAQEDVVRAKDNLDRAKASGDQDYIDKAQEKLSIAEANLQHQQNLPDIPEGATVDDIRVTKDEFFEYFTADGGKTSPYLNQEDLIRNKLLYDGWDATLDTLIEKTLKLDDLEVGDEYTIKLKDGSELTGTYDGKITDKLRSIAEEKLGLEPGELSRTDLSDDVLFLLDLEIQDVLTIFSSSNFKGEFEPLAYNPNWTPEKEKQAIEDYDKGIKDSLELLAKYGLTKDDAKTDKFNFVKSFIEQQWKADNPGQSLPAKFSKEDFNYYVLANPVIAINGLDASAVGDISREDKLYSLDELPAQVEKYRDFYDELNAASIQDKTVLITHPADGSKHNKLDTALAEFKERYLKERDVEGDVLDRDAFRAFTKYAHLTGEDADILRSLENNFNFYADEDKNLSFNVLRDYVYSYVPPSDAP